MVLWWLMGALGWYLVKADGVSTEMTKLQWWQSHEEDHPRWWSNACKQVVLIQLSSAAAERIFSLLTNSSNERQNSYLGIIAETSFVLHYNSN